MFNQLSSKGITIPNGFTTISIAFWSFIEENKLKTLLQKVLKSLDRKTYFDLNDIGSKARTLAGNGSFSKSFVHAISIAYKVRSNNNDIAVVLRNSATAEDFLMPVLHDNTILF